MVALGPQHSSTKHDVNQRTKTMKANPQMVEGDRDVILPGTFH